MRFPAIISITITGTRLVVVASYGGREGSATKAAGYNAAYAAVYHNQAAVTLHYGGHQCRIVAATTLYYGGRQCRRVAAAKCSIHCNSVPRVPNQSRMIDTTQTCNELNIWQLPLFYIGGRHSIKWRPLFYTGGHHSVKWRLPDYDRRPHKQHCMRPPWQLTPLGHHSYSELTPHTALANS